MTVPVIRGTNTTVSATAATTNILTLPAGAHQPGDSVIAVLTFRHGGGTITPPPGWVLLADKPTAVNTTAPRVMVWLLRNVQSVAATYTWDRPAGARHWTSTAIVTSPLSTIDGLFVVNSGTDSNTADLPFLSVTTGAADCLVFFAADTNTGATYTPPAGVTEIADVSSTDGGTGASDGTHVLVGYGTKSVAGATSFGAFTRSDAGSTFTSALVSFAIADVTTNASPSIAVLPPQVVTPAKTVTLTAVGTDDVSVASYTWACVSNDPVTFTGQGTDTITFTAPLLPRALTFSVYATDAQGATSQTRYVGVTVEPAPRLLVR